MSGIILGVDEVGRGSLAGPVVVGAVVFPKNHKKIKGIKDSKQLSRREREKLALEILKKAKAIGLGQASAGVFDRVGITKALYGAAKMAARKVIKKVKIDTIIIDGPNGMGLESFGVKVVPVIDGDEKIYEVSAASIVAKVYRDKLMIKLSRKYPGYGWETNVGYGTKKHVEAIKKMGLTPLHRRTFCKKFVKVIDFD